MSITYDELKKHASYNDAWISIDGCVYDITKFIPIHPFGDTFRGLLGSDCSGFFHSAHTATEVAERLKNHFFRETCCIKHVGELHVLPNEIYKSASDEYQNRIIYRPIADEPFWLDLKKEIRLFIKENKEDTHYGTVEGLVLIFYYLLIEVLLAFLVCDHGSIYFIILLAFNGMSASSSIGHMATHHGFTRNKTLNMIAMSFFDLSGASGLEWQISHQTHHNQPHSSLDYQTNDFDLVGVRVHFSVESKPYHKYQRFYYWLLIPFYANMKLFMSSYFLFFTHRHFVLHWHEKMAHVVPRIVFFSFFAVIVKNAGFVCGISTFLKYMASLSYLQFIFLYNNHEETHAPLSQHFSPRYYHYQASWPEIQVMTSGNWKPTNVLLNFLEFHYGYFNYHIEHHLFSSFKMPLCKKLSPIVETVCKKHGIPYICTSFTGMIRSFQQHLTKMGEQN